MIPLPVAMTLVALALAGLYLLHWGMCHLNDYLERRWPSKPYPWERNDDN